MISSIENKLALYDTFIDTDTVSLADHVPEVGGKWVDINSNCEIDTNAVKTTSSIGKSLMLLDAPCKQLEVSFGWVDAPITGARMDVVIRGKLNAAGDDYEDGTIGFEVEEDVIAPGSKGFNIAVYQSGLGFDPAAPGEVFHDTIHSPKDDRSSFIVQDDGRYIRYWLATEPDKIITYDTMMDSRMSQAGWTGIGFAPNLEVAKFRCYGIRALI